MATPLVTGGIGYLYLIAPLKFSQFAFTKPAEAAYEMKRIILNSSSQKSMYQKMNSQSGHLNILNASKLLHGQSINRYGF